MYCLMSSETNLLDIDSSTDITEKTLSMSEYCLLVTSNLTLPKR